jgi:hypothetical protein
LRRNAGFFGTDHGEGKQLGDLYRASQEGSGIMLRVLIEFLGVKAREGPPPTLVAVSATNADARLGYADLKGIAPVDPAKIDAAEAAKLARLHDGVSKRTGHPAFNKQNLGMDPIELEWATIWVVTQIWSKCYAPDPIPVHRDIFGLLNAGRWNGIPFVPS